MSFLAACQAIHVLMTAAVLSLQYEERKEEYVRSVSAIQSYGYEPWIVVANNMKISFFDEICTHVLYPRKNNLSLRNKGVNETLSIRASLPALPFDDEDIVVKLTGRYELHDRAFLNLIEATHEQYDLYGCFGTHFVSPNHLFTGCFAMRWKYLKKLLLEMDLQNAEIDYLPVEQLYAEFIEKNELRVKKVNPLHLRARIFYSGEGVDVLEF